MIIFSDALYHSHMYLIFYFIKYTLLRFYEINFDNERKLEMSISYQERALNSLEKASLVLSNLKIIFQLANSLNNISRNTLSQLMTINELIRRTAEELNENITIAVRECNCSHASEVISDVIITTNELESYIDNYYQILTAE